MRGSNGVSLPRQASTESAPATKAAAIARSAANRPASASAVDTCVPLSSARPSFGPSATGCSPARASASRAGRMRPSTLASPSPISTADKVRERREIAGRTHRSLRRNAGNDARVRHGDQRFDDAPPDSRMAARERCDLERDDQAHDRVVEQRSRARRMRQHQRALQLDEPRVVDPRAREEAESGVDAIDDAMLGARRWRRSLPPHPPRHAPGDRWRSAPQPTTARATGRAKGHPAEAYAESCGLARHSKRDARCPVSPSRPRRTCANGSANGRECLTLLPRQATRAVAAAASIRPCAQPSALEEVARGKVDPVEEHSNARGDWAADAARWPGRNASDFSGRTSCSV